MMDESLTYQFLSVADISEVSALVAGVFTEFLAQENSFEGVQEFQRYLQLDAFRRRSKTNHLSLIALAQNKIVGVIEMRGYHHVSLLFVVSEFQQRGIAKELLCRAVQVCRAQEPGLAEISVNSSAYAVPIYEKLGFCCTGERQIRNGISFTPMVLKLTKLPGG